MSDPFSRERKTVRIKKQNLFGSGYAGLGLEDPGVRVEAHVDGVADRLADGLHAPGDFPEH